MKLTPLLNILLVTDLLVILFLSKNHYFKNILIILSILMAVFMVYFFLKKIGKPIIYFITAVAIIANLIFIFP